MAIKNSWASGEVLTAADLTDTMKGVYLNAQTGTTYTFGTADGFVTLSNASGGTATIPTNATAAFNIGAVIGVMNAGTAGSFVIAPAATVTLNAVSGTTTLAPLESATLVKLGTNTWQLAKGSGLPKATYSATTGAPTVDTTSRPGKTIVTFTGSGSITIAGNGGTCEMLLVAGGGGGGAGGAGAGGGGGIVLDTNSYVPSGTLTVTVGAGGAGGIGGASNRPADGFNGEASRIGNYFVPGGGAGGSYDYNSVGAAVGRSGNRGGSGGGSTFGATGGTADTGNSGGVGVNTAPNYGGGGGGGHSAVGSNGGGTAGGNGGAGLTNSIDGTSRVYGSGGGGGAQGGTGGTAGTNAGNGSPSSTAASNGTANFGGGGGGGGATTTTNGNGGSGGSGRVVLVFG